MMDQKILTWNYRDTERYFSNPGVPDAEQWEYVASLKGSVKTQIFCRKAVPEETFKKVIDRDTMIFIDGPFDSCKSILAQKLASKFDATVVEDDLLSIAGLDNYDEKSSNPFANVKTFEEVDQYNDSYIIDNFEREVLAQKEKGKPVIVVGTFVNPINRAIVLCTIGKYFKKVTSIFCFEPDMKKFTLATNKRFNVPAESFVSNYFDAHYIRCFDSYDKAAFNLKYHDPNYLGKGVDRSLVFDRTAIASVP